MAELGVGEESAVDDDRRADSGALGRKHNDAVAALGCAVGDLGDARGVRVVQCDDGAAQVALHELVDVDVDPRLVEVRHVGNDAVKDGGGEGHADRNADLDVELVDDLAAHRSDSVGRRGVGGGDSNLIADVLAGFQINERALDARSADIDAACDVSHNPSSGDEILLSAGP